MLLMDRIVLIIMFKWLQVDAANDYLVISVEQ